MVMKRLFPVTVVAFLFLTGCQWGSNDMNRDDTRSPVEDTRTTRDGRTTNDGFTQNVENRNRLVDDSDRSSRNRTDQFEVSDEAAKRIVSEVDEIHQAYVLTTNNNAYVAATLSENNDRQRNRSMDGNRNRSGNKNSNMNNRSTDERSMNDGQTNRGTGDKNMSDRNTTGRDTVTDVRNRNSDGEELTDDVKKKVSDIVKDVDDNIDNVYVTTSPDFFNLTNDYIDDFQNGRPVEGLFDQMGNMIERVFPQNKR